jgi:hypothetical protein
MWCEVRNPQDTGELDVLELVHYGQVGNELVEMEQFQETDWLVD